MYYFQLRLSFEFPWIAEPIRNIKKSLEEILSGDCFTRTRCKAVS